ncbi:unnamed protein product [Prunus brigantina]
MRHCAKGGFLSVKMGLLAPIKLSTHFGSVYIKNFWKMIRALVDPSNKHIKPLLLGSINQQCSLWKACLTKANTNP